MIPKVLCQPGSDMENGLNVIVRSPTHNRAITHIIINIIDYRIEATGPNVRRAMNRIGVELFPYYLAVRMADVKAQSSYQRRAKIENIISFTIVERYW